MHQSKIPFPDCRKIRFWETCVLKISQGNMPPDPSEVWAFGPQFYRVPAYSRGSALLLQKLMNTLPVGLEGRILLTSLVGQHMDPQILVPLVRHPPHHPLLFQVFLSFLSWAVLVLVSPLWLIWLSYPSSHLSLDGVQQISSLQR